MAIAVAAMAPSAFAQFVIGGSTSNLNYGATCPPGMTQTVNSAGSPKCVGVPINAPAIVAPSPASPFVIGGSVSGQPMPTKPLGPMPPAAAYAPPVQGAACSFDTLYQQADGSLATQDGRRVSVQAYVAPRAPVAAAPKPSSSSPFVIGGSVPGYVSATPIRQPATPAIPPSGIGAYARTLPWASNERDSAASFSRAAQESGWTVDDVSESMGMSTGDVQALLSRHGLPPLQPRRTVSGSIGTSGINYFVKNLPWTGDVQADRVSTHAVYNMAVTSGWSANDVASALAGFTPESINAHLAKSGLPPLPVR